MEIKDNKLSRQFETLIEGKLLAVEYFFQERKIFLTKVTTAPEHLEDESILCEFLKKILAILEENKLKVVPVHPKTAAFFRKNPVYKEQLAVGIRL